MDQYALLFSKYIPVGHSPFHQNIQVIVNDVLIWILMGVVKTLGAGIAFVGGVILTVAIYPAIAEGPGVAADTGMALIGAVMIAIGLVMCNFG